MNTPPPADRSRHPYLLLLLAILLAGMLRLWQLDTLPLGLYHDEAYNGLDALAMTEGQTFPIFHEGWELYASEAHATRPPTPTRWPLFFEGNYGREPLHIYLMAVAISLLGPTPLAVRLVPALAGILSVLTTYLAGRALWRHTAPLAPATAALALAILYPAVHFSRFGLRAMLFVPVSTLCIYFFWRGVDGVTAQLNVKSETLDVKSGPTTFHLSRFIAPPIRHFLLAGFLLGLGLYIYAAGRLFPLLFVSFVLLWFATQRGAWRHFGLPIGLMAAVASLTALPLLIYFARYPYFFFFRTAYVANKGAGTFDGRPWLTWLANVPRVIWGLFGRGETHFRHNLPGRPFMDALQSGLFVLGTAALWPSLRAQDGQPLPPWLRTAAFPLLWLATMLLPTILSGDAPHFGRMTGAMPVIALFIGFGANQLSQWLTPRLPQWASYGVLATLLALSTGWTAVDYFYRYATHPLMQTDFYQGDWEAGRALGAFGALGALGTAESQALYLSPTQEEIATFLFALGEKRHHLRNLNADQTAVPLGWGEGADGKEYLPVFLVRNDTLTAVLNNLTPLYGSHLTLTPLTTYTLIQTTQPPSLPPLAPPTGSPIALLAHQTTASEGQLLVTLIWQATADIPTPHTAFVHLLDADGQIMAQTDRPPAGFPTQDWRVGERILDRFVIPLPAGSPPPTAVRTGFYDSLTLQPLGEPVVWER